MQLITSETITATNTDKALRHLFENTIDYWFTPKPKNRMVLAGIKFQQQIYENLNVELLKQTTIYFSWLEVKIKPQLLYQSHYLQDRESIPIRFTSSTTPKIDQVNTTITSKEIEIVRNRLIELFQEEDEDEYGLLKPTTYAFVTAWKLVSDASKLMEKSFPKASASTDDKGGIRLTWTRLESEIEVRLICPSEPSQKTYLYHEKGEAHGIIDDVTGLTLAGWLQWFNNA